MLAALRPALAPGAQLLARFRGRDPVGQVEALRRFTGPAAQALFEQAGYRVARLAASAAFGSASPTAFDFLVLAQASGEGP
jgi:hypothetical protein